MDNESTESDSQTEIKSTTGHGTVVKDNVRGRWESWWVHKLILVEFVGPSTTGIFADQSVIHDPAVSRVGLPIINHLH